MLCLVYIYCLKAIKAIRDEKNNKYIKRFKFSHDKAVKKQHKFKPGDLVGFFIGDRSGHPTSQWLTDIKFMNELN